MKLNLIGEKHAPYAKEQRSLKADIIHQLPEHHIPFEEFSAVTNLDGVVKLLVNESNFYGKELTENFTITNKKWEHL